MISDLAQHLIEKRIAREKDARDAARFRALARVDLIAWLPIPQGSTLEQFADRLIARQKESK